MLAGSTISRPIFELDFRCFIAVICDVSYTSVELKLRSSGIKIWTLKAKIRHFNCWLRQTVPLESLTTNLWLYLCSPRISSCISTCKRLYDWLFGHRLILTLLLLRTPLRRCDHWSATISHAYGQKWTSSSGRTEPTHHESKFHASNTAASRNPWKLLKFSVLALKSSFKFVLSGPGCLSVGLRSPVKPNLITTEAQLPFWRQLTSSCKYLFALSCQR